MGLHHISCFDTGVLLLLALSGQSVSLDDQPVKMVFPAGFEPASSRSKGECPRPLDDGNMVLATGIEPVAH